MISSYWQHDHKFGCCLKRLGCTCVLDGEGDGHASATSIYCQRCKLTYDVHVQTNSSTTVTLVNGFAKIVTPNAMRRLRNDDERTQMHRESNV